MAKYIIDIPDDTTYVNAIKAIDGDVVRATTIPMIDLASYTEPDRKAIDLQHAHDIENVARMNYSKGAEDAWEFAKQVTIMTPDDKCELWGTSKYNTINLGYSYAEAKAKYEEWKKQKDDAVKQKVITLADEIGIHKLYAIVKEIRGE